MLGNGERFRACCFPARQADLKSVSNYRIQRKDAGSYDEKTLKEISESDGFWRPCVVLAHQGQANSRRDLLGSIISGTEVGLLD